jgi:hypothetical protein
MKILNTARIIDLLQQRGKLQGIKQAFNTSDTIKIGDDPKAQIELPVAGIRERVGEVIDTEVSTIDAQLASLGVVIG